MRSVLFFAFALTIFWFSDCYYRSASHSARCWKGQRDKKQELKRILFRRKITVLNSYGDPDGQSESKFYRWWQDVARKADSVLAEEDPDVPGLTFLSPVEWAPWMETIWFGNYYDYRAAYFHDVMYSNNLPMREGALLFKDPKRAQQIALLYQRYKKFDQSSYSLSNATFYNIFAEESIRLGRYKVPQTDNVILCITDPLTYSEMGRYLNSFNALKWFKSQFFQQKRKRQYEMKVNDASDFFADAVYQIEYGRTVLNDKSGGQAVAGKKAVVRPLIALSQEARDDIEAPAAIDQNTTAMIRNWSAVSVSSDPQTPLLVTRLSSLQKEYISGGVVGRQNEGFLLPIRVANSQFFLENLAQSLLIYISQLSTTGKVVEAVRRDIRAASGSKRDAEVQQQLPLESTMRGLRVLLGGDGRTLNNFALDIFTRVLAGNGIQRISLSSTTGEKGCITPALTTAAAKEYLIGEYYTRDDAKQFSGTVKNCAIVFTAGDAQGGVRGSFGVQVLLTNPKEPGDAITEEDEVVTTLNDDAWREVLKIMSSLKTYSIIPARSPYATQGYLNLFTQQPRDVTTTNPPIPIPTALKGDNKVLFGSRTVLNVEDMSPYYRAAIQEEFDLKMIKSFVEKSGLIVTVDCMNSPISSFLKPILADIGLEDSLFNDKAKPDFGGIIPAAKPTTAKDSMELFGAVEPIIDDLVAIHSDLYGDEEEEEGQQTAESAEANQITGQPISTSSTPVKKMDHKKEKEKEKDGKMTEEETEEEENLPDIGFVFDADARNVMVLAPKLYLSQHDTLRSLRLLQSDNMNEEIQDNDDASGKDGVRTMLSWLTLLARANNDKNSKNKLSTMKYVSALEENTKALVGVHDILLETWCREGRDVFLDVGYDVNRKSATNIVTRFLKLFVASIESQTKTALMNQIQIMGLSLDDLVAKSRVDKKEKTDDDLKDDEDDKGNDDDDLDEDDDDDIGVARRRRKEEEEEKASLVVPVGEDIQFSLKCATQAVLDDLTLLAKLCVENINNTSVEGVALQLKAAELMATDEEAGKKVSIANDTEISKSSIVSSGMSVNKTIQDAKDIEGKEEEKVAEEEEVSKGSKKTNKKRDKKANDDGIVANATAPRNISSILDDLVKASLQGHLGVSIKVNRYPGTFVQLSLRQLSAKSPPRAGSLVTEEKPLVKVVLHGEKHVPAQTFRTIASKTGKRFTPTTALQEVGPALVTAFEEALIADFGGVSVADGQILL